MSRSPHESDPAHKAQDFKAPSDNKRSGEGSIPSRPDHPKVEQESASRTITTLEELDADIAARDSDEAQRQAEWQRQEDEKQQQWTEKQRGKWEPKTRALKALRITGKHSRGRASLLRSKTI